MDQASSTCVVLVEPQYLLYRYTYVVLMILEMLARLIFYIEFKHEFTFFSLSRKYMLNTKRTKSQLTTINRIIALKQIERKIDLLIIFTTSMAAIPLANIVLFLFQPSNIISLLRAKKNF